VWSGGTTYGGTLTPSNWNSTLALANTPPPFDFAAQFATLRERSAQWADLEANGTVSGPRAGALALTLTGSDASLDVFEITAAQLQSARQVQITVPDGATVLINVPDISYISALSSVSLAGTTPAQVLWNFPRATSVTSTVGFAWQGSILAPHATVTLVNGQLNRSVVAASLSTGTESSGGYQTNHIAFTGCFPPAGEAPGAGVAVH
jgi:choice-of-anchor A domain-containing protein